MALWLLLICGICSLWPRSASAGSCESKINVPEGPYIAREADYTSLPPGTFLANLRRLLDAHRKAQAFGPNDGFTKISMYMPQEKLRGLQDSHQFKLRVHQESMLIDITSLHRYFGPRPWEYTNVQTRGLYSGKRLKEGPEIQHCQGSPPDDRGDLLIAPKDLPQFDVDDVLKVMRLNWSRRILFNQAPISHVDMSIQRLSKGHPFRALRGRMVIKFSIADHDTYFAADDGPNYANIFALPFRIDSRDIYTISKPPEWLRRVESVNVNQDQVVLT